MIEPERLECILDFLATIDRFKSIARAVPLRDQSRLESDAEHTWHMGLFALLLERELALEVQLGHVLELILVHDLVEIYAGDAYAHDPVARRDKRAREVTAATRLFPMLPPISGRCSAAGGTSSRRRARRRPGSPGPSIGCRPSPRTCSAAGGSGKSAVSPRR